MFRRNEKGFTLVELMIVVVIIGILAAIAIPKFSSMVGRAKTSEAKTVLGQIINLENIHWNMSSEYVVFAVGDDCPEIGFEQPVGDNVRFSYLFEKTDDLTTTNTNRAIAQEIEDVNGNGNLDDGLILAVTGERTSLTNDLVW